MSNSVPALWQQIKDALQTLAHTCTSQLPTSHALRARVEREFAEFDRLPLPRTQEELEQRELFGSRLYRRWREEYNPLGGGNSVQSFGPISTQI